LVFSAKSVDPTPKVSILLFSTPKYLLALNHGSQRQNSIRNGPIQRQNVAFQRQSGKRQESMKKCLKALVLLMFAPTPK